METRTNNNNNILKIKRITKHNKNEITNIKKEIKKQR